MYRLSKQKLITAAALTVIVSSLLAVFDVPSGPLRLLLGGFSILLLPGMLLLSSMQIRRVKGLTFGLYAVGLSLVYLLFGGLLLNSIGPLLGIERPLDTLPVVGFHALCMAALLVLAYRRLPRYKRVRLPTLQPRDVTLAAISLTLPLLSWLGATLLNNGGQNYLILVMLGGIGGLLVALVALRKRAASWVWPLAIFGMSLALLLMYSLRSWHVVGWDVNLEYRVFQVTQAAGHWSMANLPGDAYNACLSITLLPTMLQVFFGGQSEYIFKFVMQALFALVPVAIYTLSRRYTSSVVAFLAALVYAGQAWFIEQMPALVRQEIAFVFLALALLVVFDAKLTTRTRSTLAGLFSFCIVLSHYSTTYIWLAMLLITLTFALLLKVATRIFYHRKQRRLRIDYRWVLATVLFAFVWNTQLTKTSSSAGSFAQNTWSQMSQLFTLETLRGGLEQVSFAAKPLNTPETLAQQYQQLQGQYQKDQTGLYESQKTAQPQWVDDSVKVAPLIPEVIGSKLTAAAQVIKLLLINVFSIIGIGGLWWLFKKQHKLRLMHRDYLLLCFSTLPLIAIIVFMPFVQESYNLTRLFMQTFLVLALPTVLGCLLIVRWLPKFRYWIATGIIVVFVAYSAGAIGQLTGGSARVTLNGGAEQVDMFYTTDAEVASAKWLGQHAEPEVPIYADAIAHLRLKAYTALPETNFDFFPGTMYQDSYAYTSAVNLLRGVAYYPHQGETLSYRAPIDFLESNKDKIYSNGRSNIYR